jgi:hypothetical protein
MEDTREFREALVGFCQAPLADARRLLEAAPELLSDHSEGLLSDLADIARESDDWRSRATIRRAMALVRRARRIGVEPAIAEAQAAERGDLPDALVELPHRAARASARYEESGSLGDLEDEIACWDSVLEHPLLDRVDPGLRWAALIDGAAAYFTRWEHSGRAADLDTAIERWLEVRVEMHPGAESAATMHDNLAVAFIARYQATGRPADLASAVEAAEAAVAEARPADPGLPKFKADLAGALQERYLSTGSLADLDRAITLYETAVGDMPPGSAVYASVLNNLATALTDRFQRTADPADRDRAAELLGHAVDSTAERSVHRDRHLANLAGQASTPGEAIEMRRRILADSSANPAVRAANLNNVAASLIDEFLRTYDRSALEEAIELLEEALDMTDAGSPDLALYSLNCGNARRLHFIVALDPDEQMEQLLRGTDVLDDAIAAGSERNPKVALQAARHAGDWYGEIENWEQSVAAYQRGLDAAGRLLQVQLSRQDKETWLKTIADLPSQAAYANAQAGDARAAAVAIEQGHAILLAEALDLKHADLDRLQAAGRGELRKRFEVLLARWNELLGMATA